MIKQITVFLENRSSRLDTLTDVMLANKIHIVSITFSDSSEYGLIRMVVSPPDKAFAVLKEKGFAVSMHNVLCVGVPPRKGATNEMMKLLSSCEIDYLYKLATKDDVRYLVVKVADVYSAMAILENKDFVIADAELVYSMY